MVISCNYLPQVILDCSFFSSAMLQKEHLPSFNRWRTSPHLLHEPTFKEFISSQEHIFKEINTPTAPSPPIFLGGIP